MRVFLAWHNVLANGRRLLAAAAGIGFAILLVFVQVGSIDAIRRASTLVFDAMDFDLILVSNEYQYLNRTGSILSTHLAQARVVPGIERVAPMDYKVVAWEDPETQVQSPVMLLGLDSDPDFVRDPDIAAGLPSIRNLGRAMIDELCGSPLGSIATGREVRINGRNTTLAARFRMGMRFYSQGTAIVSSETFRKLVPRFWDRSTFGLIRLAPDADAEAVIQRIREVLPDEVVAFERDHFLQMEKDHYTTEMPLGIMARFGVAVALLMGAVVVFQVLSTDFSNRLTEYATLKAAGFSTGYIYGVGVQQATLFALLAYLPALGLSSLLFHGTNRMTSLPMFMTGRIALLVLSLSLAMCLAAGLAALRTVHRADPADLF